MCLGRWLLYNDYDYDLYYEDEGGVTDWISWIFRMSTR